MASALLSHHRTDVNGPGKHGMTPLMYAAQAGHDRMAVLLLRLRSDRYRCNDQVGTASVATVRRFVFVLWLAVCCGAFVVFCRVVVLFAFFCCRFFYVLCRCLSVPSVVVAVECFSSYTYFCNLFTAVVCVVRRFLLYFGRVFVCFHFYAHQWT